MSGATTIYPAFYPSTYGFAWPLSPLDVEVGMDLGNGGWTDITPYVYQRDGSSAPIAITRGRPDEATQANPSAMTCELNNRDGRFTVRNPAGAYYGLLSRNTPIRVSVPAQASYLRSETDQLSSAWCPDNSRLHITGDLDLRLDLHVTHWGSSILAAKFDGSASQNCWYVTLGSEGLLNLGWSPAGTVAGQSSAQSTLPVPMGRLTIRVTLQASTGTVTFYTAAPGNADSSTGWTQLGSAAVTGATSVFAGTAALSVGNVPPAWYSNQGTATEYGTYGSIYEAELRSGIGGTVVAHPVFTAQTAGATSFTDAPGNAWTLAGTAEISDRSYRYHGEMSSLPPAWDTSGEDMHVPLAAGGILRRLGQGDAPLNSPMKRALLAQSGDLAVVAYWPCEDLQGATSIGSATGGPLMAVSGGTGDGSVTTTGPAFAASSAFLGSNSLPTLNGSSWYGGVPAYESNGSIVVRFLMDLGSTIPAGNRDLFRIITTGTCQEISMRVYSATNIGVYGNNSGGSSVFTSGSVNFGPDMPSGTVQGTTLWVSIELQPGTGSTVDYSLVVLYPGATTAYAFNGTFTGTIGNVSAVYVDPAQVYTDTVIGHVSVQSAWESLFNLASPLNAWQGETAGDRFARLCGENSIPCRIYGPQATTVPMGAQSIDTLTDLLQECETADRGQIFEPRRSYGVGYRTQASMLQQAAAVTLDYSQAMLGADSSTILQPTYDDLLTRNDETVQRSSSQVSGASFQYQLNDGSPMSISPPPAGVGDYSDTESVNVQADAQLPDMASWMVHIGTVDEARWPSVPVNMARAEVAGVYYEVLESDIGDFFGVINPPSQMPPDEIRQLLWEIAENLGGFWYQLTWGAVPESPYETGVYNDPVYGRADTDGSALHTAVTSAATSLTVATDAGYPVWTTAAADFPFDIAIGGERMTVTGITGASSPQAFTVTRSVNGVVKSQAAGADVRLWFPPVYAML